jgi:hypothetical protein
VEDDEDTTPKLLSDRIKELEDMADAWYGRALIRRRNRRPAPLRARQPVFTRHRPRLVMLTTA